MIIIAGTIDLDPDRRDEAVAASVPLQQATRDDEPGCLAYCFAADPCVDGRLQVYELWADSKTLDAHFQHENYFNMRDALHRFGLRGADTTKYRVDATDPVYKDGVAAARFWSVEGS
ncbi:MAG: antibiotic biosynthesis monooxygenase [Acidimicrobiia bacterium]|nr:antibiotic biosynthesis monooxygenase [Acidimicrobiia bacterium]